MTKIKKQPKFHFGEFQKFGNIVPNKEIDEVLFNEFPDIFNNIKNPRSKISIHLKKYIIIRLVTIIESHLKYLIAHLIDEHGIKINKLFPDGTVTLQLNNLDDVRKKEFSIGKMTAMSFNFQNPQEANWVFSTLLGIKLFENLIEFGKIATKNNLLDKVEAEHFEINEKEFFEMFSIRNEIVHTMRTPHKMRKKPEYFEQLWDGSYHFLRLVFEFAETFVQFKEQKLKKNELHIFFSIKTKEYRKNQKSK
ncbi:MAG: hypothetical protein ACW9W4_05635 [Candidatus Nitrosopumilus sp. bin_7KS]